jgi:hypothetical protein
MDICEVNVLWKIQFYSILFYSVQMAASLDHGLMCTDQYSDWVHYEVYKYAIKTQTAEIRPQVSGSMPYNW